MVSSLHTVWSEFKREFKRGQCLLKQVGIELVSEPSQFWVAFCLEWTWMLDSIVCMLFVVWGSFYLSLNDDCESNVREVIQNLELLTDLRETLRRKVGIVLDWLDCDTCHVWVVVFMSWVLLLETLNLVLWVISCTCGMIKLSWHMMRTWEETQTESESK